MSITNEDVKKVSYLARIHVKDSEISNIKSSLNGILEFVDQLNEVDCSSVNEIALAPTITHEREDIVIPHDPSLMDNAPQKECNMFVVPKIVG
ncbi:MAG: Asp-tRNA(Asn)/Glu-tRNA(Gln) amidotransferase subunit GatC [Holosporaceae bacterium]|jgi:aspartyl-tRNA(Asn)/glutamyl-tRNA(Gln) amidotransferase subunit C|nr:Asp-tRNA(Asn)/Glu-tRNA(Gln) amidotransferase subunit GatC [Holosporaceae bacterium]